MQILATKLRSNQPETSCIQFIAATELLTSVDPTNQITDFPDVLRYITVKACIKIQDVSMVITSMLRSQGSSYFCLVLAVIVAHNFAQFVFPHSVSTLGMNGIESSVRQPHMGVFRTATLVQERPKVSRVCVLHQRNESRNILYGYVVDLMCSGKSTHNQAYVGAYPGFLLASYHTAIVTA
ncbi:hypothetical protein BDR03DRAFT_414554 [Suillus americanus]|nr:hypothetical protein BDR03DRAFT_414554 [Suillus americanus]